MYDFEARPFFGAAVFRDDLCGYGSEGSTFDG